MRKAKWSLTLPLQEARKNEEIIPLSSRQTLDFINDIQLRKNTDFLANNIKKQIKTLKKQEQTVKSRKEIRRLYDELDKVLFNPDYMCLVIERKSDYLRALKGFTINGIKYRRLLGTNGGVKNNTIVFVNADVYPELIRRLNNGRDKNKPLVPGKFESYLALSCSGSTPVSMPNGILIVDDCETKFKADVINITDEAEGEPIVTTEANADVELDESDGYGIMLPALAERWSKDLGLNYIASGVNTRFAWEKGMVFCFDFLDFADKVSHTYFVKDAWGNMVDIRNVELILTTSMVKLWDSYSSCDDYLRNCNENKYSFRVAKVCPKELESERNLNYQFIQSYNLSDEDIDKLISPTINEIKDIISGDYKKTILFLKGMYLNEYNVKSISNDFVKALMIDKRMIEDPFVRSNVFKMIRKRIEEAKIGVVKVHGNYSIVSGDPYSLCQSIFNLPVTGLLKSGEIYNKYWSDINSDKLACFRAPMTCHNNIRLMRSANTEEMKYWYKYMTTCTIFNSWDASAHALNGMDKDGDLVMLTNNDVLVNNLVELPAIMCVQRRAEKRVICEEDLIEANISSFGDDIGKITNRITTMFEVQSKFDKDSKEYKELDYRIMCGQLFQQNAIDRVKGIVAKPMPKEWYDRSAIRAMDMSTPEARDKHDLYLNILADKKPYFMIYIYPDLMKDYKTYIKSINKKSSREFRMTIEELISKSNKTELELEMVKYYHHRLPVGNNDCVMNKICHRFEKEFDGYLVRHRGETYFDYSILKSDSNYTTQQYRNILRLYDEYIDCVQKFMVRTMHDRNSDEYSYSLRRQVMVKNFKRKCYEVCSDPDKLCNIILDICYSKNNSKQFVWDVCGDNIINILLEKNNHTIYFPAMDIDGDISFGGYNFKMCSTTI